PGRQANLSSRPRSSTYWGSECRELSRDTLPFPTFLYVRGPSSGVQLLPVASKEVAQWYKATWLQLYKLVHHRVQSREEAQALTQEAYVNCRDGYLSRPWENRSSRPDQFPPPWSYVQTISLNLIRDRWRKRN